MILMILLSVNRKRGVKLIWRSLVRLMAVVWTELMFQNISIFDSIIKLFFTKMALLILLITSGVNCHFLSIRMQRKRFSLSSA